MMTAEQQQTPAERLAQLEEIRKAVGPHPLSQSFKAAAKWGGGIGLSAVIVGLITGNYDAVAPAVFFSGLTALFLSHEYESKAYNQRIEKYIQSRPSEGPGW